VAVNRDYNHPNLPDLEAIDQRADLASAYAPDITAPDITNSNQVTPEIKQMIKEIGGASDPPFTKPELGTNPKTTTGNIARQTIGSLKKGTSNSNAQ
jgi:hypothetical protein